MTITTTYTKNLTDPTKSSISNPYLWPRGSFPRLRNRVVVSDGENGTFAVCCLSLVVVRSRPPAADARVTVDSRRSPTVRGSTEVQSGLFGLCCSTVSFAPIGARGEPSRRRSRDHSRDHSRNQAVRREHPRLRGFVPGSFAVRGLSASMRRLHTVHDLPGEAISDAAGEIDTFGCRC